MKSIDHLEYLINERNNRKSKWLFTLTSHYNRDEIIKVIRECSKIGVDAAVLHRLFNIHNVDSAYETLSECEERDKILRDLGRKSRFKIYLPRRHTLPCRIVKNTIFITYDGKVTPCCFLSAI